MTPDNDTGTAAERINVLLVDDNEQWANFLRDDLERTDPSLAVSVALSANEAMVTLAEESIDVVVADYRMPEIDGLQLLERIREDRSHFPFILVTAAGSEEVAATAIEAGVTDYLVKNPNTDQTKLLARRIRSAFDSFALRDRLRESEERYRTVAEQSHDAIAIIQDEQLVYHNERLAEVIGRDAESLEHIDFIDELIHEDDRNNVRERFQDQSEERLFEARLRTTRGDIRNGEFTWATIDHGNAAAILLSIRDITRRKRREERIDRERRLNRGIFDMLVESMTRTEVESFVATELVDHGYDLVWIGTPTEAGIASRVEFGKSGYLERLLSDGIVSSPGEPVVVATRTGEPTFIDDIADLLGSNWLESAEQANFRSAGALPIIYDDVRYGVLAVYHDAPAQFDEIERELLREAARTLAFSIHHVETQRSLGADSRLAVNLSVSADSDPISTVLADPEFDTSTVEATVSGTHAGIEGRTVRYVTIIGAPIEDVADRLLDVSGVVDVLIIDQSDSCRLQLTTEQKPVESVIINRGGRFEQTTISPDGATVRFTIGDRTVLSEIVSDMRDRDGTVAVESIGDADPPDPDTARQLDLESLTDKQIAALEAAHQHGYFEQPRGASATEIAEALQVSHSTYLQHLRAAQRKISTALFS